jgi:hypothetical protein
MKKISELSRRDLLKLFGVSVGAGILDPAVWPRNVQAQSKKVTPRKTARNVIFIQNCGAMSQHETFDFKETKWTAKDLDIQKVNSDFLISKTLFPNYQRWAPKATLVRSLWENSLVHFTGQYHSQAGRAFNPAILREIPAMGSLIASELDHERRESDTFPTFMSVDLWNSRCPQIGAGMLGPRFAGMDLNTDSVFDSFGGEGGGTTADLSRRWEVLNRISEVSPSGSGDSIGGKADEYGAHYQYAYKILTDPRFKPNPRETSEEIRKRFRRQHGRAIGRGDEVRIGPGDRREANRDRQFRATGKDDQILEVGGRSGTAGRAERSARCSGQGGTQPSFGLVYFPSCRPASVSGAG